MFFLKAAGVAIEAGSALVFELCWRQGASFFLLIWAKLQVACWGLGDATQESRKEFKVRFRRVGSDWRGLQDFCFQLLSLF